MTNKITHCLPNHMTPEVFLTDYWQKKPLLIKNGLPNLINMFTPDDILELALEDEVLARLITQDDHNPNSWSLKCSPLKKKDFKSTPKLWTVLIQNLEAWSNDLGKLWQAFDFIPKWQQDDIMVSYAPDGGSVGRHYDEYDVFLAQGYGKRRWQLGKFCDTNTAFIDGQPIRLLDDMGEIIFDEILEAGDVLYVPPRLSHYGLAIGDCLTFSFGFRRPSTVQILDKLADVATSDKYLFSPLLLNQPLQNSQELTQSTIDELKADLIKKLQSGQLDAIFKKAMSELLSRRQYEPIAFFDELDSETLIDLLEDGATLSLNYASRFIKQDNNWYINGELVCFDDEGLALLDKVLNDGVIGLDDLETINIDALLYWVNNCWLSINE